ncbi:Ni/Fe-hydrogenase, b-type cytochrome subunit [Desulfuribacillus alkaliarsenatis]|uniref:Ni/Fe-hydrogenase, b-type cytochrome subunit n=1 Tax=Desulfuribacillus alkaliarsenatis TaxID=766136 RepID=A0A1E5G0C3_9FIRM|nr:Ni/Fe-hydrogenase, b-type cytochrome subunit [Desulfuribacillus alkaliarsenatis]OEF96281.1 Ni/Fe-hydrogenase, b-type cytochrome subunit [Desulfuribacillus alkaliarsenatis]
MLKQSKYIWELPVRIYHWLNAILIVVLLITGFYIGRPVFGHVGEPTNYFLMGWMILIHRYAAWLFIANMIFRFYWAFVGNEYARFRPWRRGFAKDGLETLKYYLFFKKEHTLEHGHNVLAQLSYFFIIWIGSTIMIITGFILQGEMHPDSFQAQYFGWLLPYFGNSILVRSLHHYVAWAFVWFIIAHLYLVIRQDILDEDGTISAIISGYKFIPVNYEPHSPAKHNIEMDIQEEQVLEQKKSEDNKSVKHFNEKKL